MVTICQANIIIINVVYSPASCLARIRTEYGNKNRNEGKVLWSYQGPSGLNTLEFSLSAGVQRAICRPTIWLWLFGGFHLCIFHVCLVFFNLVILCHINLIPENLFVINKTRVVWLSCLQKEQLKKIGHSSINVLVNTLKICLWHEFTWFFTDHQGMKKQTWILTAC